MFEWLRKHWKVNNRDLVLILCTFAVTGTTTAWITKEITHWFSIERGSAMGWTLRIGMLVFGYQIIILIVGALFGQFKFFWRYEKKILGRMGLIKKDRAPLTADSSAQHRIAIFASGTGSNAEKIIEYFKGHASITVALIVCNKPGAGVIKIAESSGIPVLLINKERLERDGYLSELESYKINFIVLAGFLLKIPSVLITAFPRRIINIHPALLPKYGGKDMYGARVHDSVIGANEAESGITIHYVDEIYDHGEVIFSAKCVINSSDTASELAHKIHQLEHMHYPKVIEQVIL